MTNQPNTEDKPIEIEITYKNGEKDYFDPVINITLTLQGNSYDYDLDPREIGTIIIRERAEEQL